MNERHMLIPMRTVFFFVGYLIYSTTEIILSRDDLAKTIAVTRGVFFYLNVK